jgi:hypothetical protein
MEAKGQLHAPAALLPGNQFAVPIVEEAEWVPEPVWMLWRREKSLGHVRNLILIPWSFSQ